MNSEVDYINGMNLGLGFSTATEDIHSPALDNVNNTREVLSAGGQEVFFKVELASSTESITEKMNVSAKASLKYGMTGNGSARVAFSNSFKQDSYSIYVIVQVIVTNKQTLLDLSNVKLKPEAVSLYNQDQNAFIQQYGDSFVYGLITGGEFIGVLEINSTTTSELNEIRAALSGQATYGLYDGSMNVSFQEILEKITASYQLKATVYRQGGSGVLQEVTPESMIQEALEFPQTVAGDGGFPRSALIIPYNHIARESLPSLNVSYQTSCLERMGNLYKRFTKYQNDLTYALDYQLQFPEINIDQVNERFNEISGQLQIIMEAGRSCSADSNACKIPDVDLTLLKDILPQRINSIGDLGVEWIEQEAGWIGVWTRRGLSNTFDGKWAKPGEPDYHAILTILRNGNDIFVIRKEHENGPTTCTYVGVVGNDGKSVTGTYRCANEHSWSATINF
ncbi:hypothetical protein [Bacillus sp. ME78]|uniref:hypothetical protein n=1 Tax=Bacillus sp. ME78 TaxID=2744261 RepID=UPI0016003523|nr:hypothetical protein [Bacillus sp. ME78]